MKDRSRQTKCLRQLVTLLQRMESRERRQSILQMPSRARAAMLEFMTHSAAMQGTSSGRRPATVSCDAFSEDTATASAVPKARVRTCRRRPSARHAKHGKATSRGGIRSVRPGAFQASICFSRLLVRSRTTRCPAQAADFHRVLLRMCHLVTADSTFRQHASCRTLEDKIRSARQTALAEVGLAENELRPSYATVVSSGSVAGSFESPTTPSLAQALSWRRRLALARNDGWSELRSVWLEVLRERHQRCAKFQRRLGTAPQFLAERATKRVDAAWSKHSERRVCLVLQREALQRQKAERVRKMLERRSAAANLRLKATVERWVVKLESLLEADSHTSYKRQRT